MIDFDIAIIGLGPAGTLLARHLAPYFDVIAFDREKSTGAGFRKPCGGLLAPAAQKSLASLNLTLPKSIMVDPQIFSVRTLDVRSGLEQYYQRFYLNLDRHKFDLWLKSLIPPSVSIVDSPVSRIKPLDGGLAWSVTAGGKEVTARYIVGADGANSLVRRQLYPGKKTRSYAAIQQWFPQRHPTPFYACIFDEQITDCYSWGISKDDYFIMGGAYPKDKAKARFEEQKTKLKNFGFELENPIRTEGCLVLRPERHSDILTGYGNAFLIGEAAGFISPSSLEGISGAIQSALALGCALVHQKAQAQNAYRHNTSEMRLRLMGKCLKTPFLYNPTLRRLAMRSGLSSITVEA